jgi:mersacidin/lichenicidin family type 2 lantibiotic
MAIDIVRAWKDPEYRKSLTPTELASLPASPAGVGDLSDDELSRIAGGMIDFGTLTTTQGRGGCSGAHSGACAPHDPPGPSNL